MSNPKVRYTYDSLIANEIDTGTVGISGLDIGTGIFNVPSSSNFDFKIDTVSYMKILTTSTKLDHMTELTNNHGVNIEGVLLKDNLITANQITISVPPSNATDVTTKSYVDNQTLGLSWKSPVMCATTADIADLTTEALTIHDAVQTIENGRVLVWNQTLPAQNGIYLAHAVGGWTRSTDMDDAAEFTRAAVYVQAGTANGSKQFVQTLTVAAVGVDPVTFVQFGGALGQSSITADTIIPYTVGLGNGVTVDSVLLKAGKVYTDQILKSLAGVNGVTVDSFNLKNGVLLDGANNIMIRSNNVNIKNNIGANTRTTLTNTDFRLDDVSLTIYNAAESNINMLATTNSGIYMDRGLITNDAAITYQTATANRWKVGVIGTDDYRIYSNNGATYPLKIAYATGLTTLSLGLATDTIVHNITAGVTLEGTTTITPTALNTSSILSVNGTTNSTLNLNRAAIGNTSTLVYQTAAGSNWIVGTTTGTNNYVIRDVGNAVDVMLLDQINQKVYLSNIHGTLVDPTVNAGKLIGVNNAALVGYMKDAKLDTLQSYTGVSLVLATHTTLTTGPNVIDTTATLKVDAITGHTGTSTTINSCTLDAGLLTAATFHANTGVVTDLISPHTPAGTVTVLGSIFGPVAGDIDSPGIILVDTINGHTGADVTVAGVILSGGSVTLGGAGTFNVNTIAPIAPALTVTIENVGFTAGDVDVAGTSRVKTNTIIPHGGLSVSLQGTLFTTNTVDVVGAPGTVKTNNVVHNTAGASVTIETGSVFTTGGNLDMIGTLKVDTITEKGVGNGVTIELVEHEDGIVGAPIKMKANRIDEYTGGNGVYLMGTDVKASATTIEATNAKFNSIVPKSGATLGIRSAMNVLVDRTNFLQPTYIDSITHYTANVNIEGVTFLTNTVTVPAAGSVVVDTVSGNTTTVTTINGVVLETIAGPFTRSTQDKIKVDNISRKTLPGTGVYVENTLFDVNNITCAGTVNVDQIAEKTGTAGTNINGSTCKTGGIIELNKIHLIPGATPVGPTEGDMYLDSTTHILNVYAAGTWHALWV